MNLPFELFIALRYLMAGRKQAFISLISLISTIGVAVGVMALLIALALMTGLQSELRDRIVGAAAHVYVWKVNGIRDPAGEVKKLRELPRVTGAAPVVLGKGLITSKEGEAFITIKAIDPDLEKGVTHVDRALEAGSMDRLVNPDGPQGILIGRDLAQSLQVHVGDLVEVTTPEGMTNTPFGPIMRPRRLQVAGIFTLGLFEFDSGYGFVSLDTGMRMLGREHPDYVELRLDDMFKAQEVVDTIVARLGAEYNPQDWADLNRNLFSALWLEKMAISITIGLIVMVAALNIIASLILLVMEKNRDIAILKTMGSSAASVRRIFMLQGLIIGLVGTTAGAIGGCLLIYIFDRYKLIQIPIDVYQISYVPFTLEPQDFVIVVLSAILICFVATIYPSRLAAKLDPAVALRYQ
ncbi:MAG: ABC transporter permease [Vicinamibacterales bacterium]